MKIRVQTTNDGAAHDWMRVFADDALLIEGRQLTAYEVLFELSERFPKNISLAPIIARGYIADIDVDTEADIEYEKVA